MHRMSRSSTTRPSWSVYHTLLHSFTPSLPHFFTPSLLHSLNFFTPSLTPFSPPPSILQLSSHTRTHTHTHTQNMYLERPLGLLALLDEESVFPRATDSTLVAKFVRNFGKHEHFQPSLTNLPVFDIRHYAGDVTYTAHGFLNKNRDRLAGDVVKALQASKLAIMGEMFFGRITDTGRLEPMVLKPSYGRATVSRKMHSAKQYASGVSKRPPSVSSHFRNSLSQLVTKMQQCSPHFVRCIKPNTSKAPWTFDTRYITMQLRYTGVLDTIRIRKEGYSWRPKYQEFVDSFRVSACLPRLPPTKQNSHAHAHPLTHSHACAFPHSLTPMHTLTHPLLSTSPPPLFFCPFRPLRLHGTPSPPPTRTRSRRF